MKKTKIAKVIGSGVISLFLIAVALAPFVIRILLRVGVIAPEVNILTIIAAYAPIIFLFPAMVAGAYIMEEFLPMLFDVLPKEVEICEEKRDSISDFTTDFAIYRATGDVPWYNN
ncbi:MAG: hypothetical protein IJN50_00480 [Clostridia bacterium]|nr:hypothetical protein [Clostridia bacterium]